MARKFQIVLMIFCLGIFIIPKQNFYAQNTERYCCKGDSKKDCCKTTKDKSCHDSKKNKKNSCEGNCNDCKSCADSLMFVELLKETSQEKNNIYYKTKKVFNYRIPYFSNDGKSIWQPPKIG